MASGVTRRVSTVLAIEGESEYRQALKNINSEMTSLTSQLKLTESEFANHQNSMEALQAKSKVLAEQQEVLAKKVQTCKEAYANAQTALTNYQARTESLKAALTQNQTALDSLSAETKTAGTQWANYQTQLAQAEKELDALKNSTGDTSTEQSKLEKTISDVKARMAELESSTDGAAKTAGELVLEQRDLTNELEKAQAGTEAASTACQKWETQQNNAQIQLNKTNNEIELNEKYMQEAASSADGFATSIDEFGNKVKTADTNTASMKDTLQNLQNLMITNILMNAFKKLASALSSCVDAAADFESQMSTVEALSGATSSEMADLTAVAKEMGATTKFTATEAGEALEYMALAGWSTDEMLDGLSGIMNLAAAAGEDLATTSDIVTDALTAFGYSASDAGHFADVLASASANSNTTVSQLGEAFQAVGTTAGTLGYSIDDVSVALGLMANNGLKGSTAGTALATALTRMSGANSTATDEMERLGVSMYNADGTAKDLNVFITELRDAFQTSGMTAQEMQVACYNLAGQKGMKGLQAILNSTDDDFQSLTESITASTGAAEEMAETRLDNYEGQVTLLNSAFDALKTTIGEQLTPTLGDLAEMGTNVLNSLNGILSGTPEITAAFSGLTAALGLAAGGLAVAKVAMAAWNAVCDTNPILLVVTALGALTAGVAAFSAIMVSNYEQMDTAYNNAMRLKDAIEADTDAWQESKDAVGENAASTSDLIDTLTRLDSKTNLSAGEQAVLLDTINKLNEAVPGLNLTYDEQGKVLNKTTKEVQAFADAQTVDEEYQTALDNVTTLYNDMQTASDQLAESERELAEAQENTNEATFNYIDPSMGVVTTTTDAEQAVSDLTNAVDTNRQALEEATAAYEEAQAIIEAYNVTNEETADTTTLVVSYAEELGAKLIELQQAYDEVYESAYDSMSGQFELWEQADEVVTTSFDDMMSALESQQKYWEDYTDNLDNLMGRQIDGLDDLIAAYGDDAAAVASMADLTDEELQDMANQWHTTQEAMSGSAAKYADAITDYSDLTQEEIRQCVESVKDLDQSEEARQLAYDTLQGYVEGIDEESDDVDAELVQVAQSLLEEFAEELGIHSPSKVFEEYGENTLQGYQNGIDNESGTATSKMEQTAQSFIKAFSNIADGSALAGSGTSTISGYISGVNSQKATADKQMEAVAQEALKSFKDLSTSTALSEAGQTAITGFITGVNGKTTASNTKMAETAKAALASFKDNMTSTALTSAGQNTLQGFINGLNNTASTLYNKMTSIASNALSKFKKTLGIASPSKEMIAAAKFTTAGFIQGIDDTTGDVEDTMEKLAKQAEDAFNPILDYDVAEAQAAYSGSTLAGEDDTETMIQVTVPIYINGQYTRTEIVEIAREGISRKQAGVYAAKGLSV